MDFVALEKKLNLVLPSPINEVNHSLLHAYGQRLWVKRDDAIHPIISGNKYRKLKYVLAKYFTENYRGIVSFGGAYSNHLHALAFVCSTLEIPLVAYIRGDELQPTSNATLQFLTDHGAVLKFLDRSQYRAKTTDAFIADLNRNHPEYLVVAEGGAGLEGRKGCGDIIAEVSDIENYQAIHVSAGTATTAAGMIATLANQNYKGTVYVYHSLRGFAVKEWITTEIDTGSVEIMEIDQFHFGGFGKSTPDLQAFIKDFEAESGVSLDPIYNGKLIFGLFNLIQAHHYPSQTKHLWVHTGGLQGKQGH